MQAIQVPVNSLIATIFGLISFTQHTNLPDTQRKRLFKQMSKLSTCQIIW